ncbi:MAG TPA: fatty acid desaturase family protein [Stellaceae bacterium]|nr:fatty acid desaturase family protein [Stellaceae bacterium]
MSDLLEPEEIRAFGARSDLIGALLVLHAWGLVFAAMALFALWPNPLTFVVAVMVIGGRQLGLAILMHDAAHGLLFTRKAVNDAVAQWFCAWPVATDLALYRPYHLKHHRFTQQAEDPDLVLSAPFPITRASLRRKIIRDLTGQTGYQRRKAQFADAWGPRELTLRQHLARLRERLGGAALANLALCAGLATLGYWWLYPALWLLPMMTWYQLVSRIRNIAEHAVVPDNDDPLRNTRTTLAGPLVRLLLAPYRVNYHLEHHLLPGTPCWRLPQVHRRLLAKGYGARMELRRGYREVLAMATSALGSTGAGGDTVRPGAQQYI